MIDSFSDHLKIKGVKIREYHSLRDETYIKIDTLARLVIYPEDENEFTDVLDCLNRTEIPYRVLGRLSNVLFREFYYDGVIVKTDKIDSVDIKENLLTLGCGCFFPTVVKRIAEEDLGGFEGLSGIPGSVGGMIKQNAGAFGYRISDRLMECTAYDVANSRLTALDSADLHFGYRTSVIGDEKYVVISAKFKAESMIKQEIYSMINEYSGIRRSAQPINEPSLGSVFKRFDGIGAGYFIDRLGLKGFSLGDAMISTKHAGFIVNGGNARSSDVLKLIDYIKTRVLAEFGITLEEEIEII